ncbi:MAG: bacteriocin-protection protein, YdeI/OmpD-associated family [Acidobacteria bacterium]|nr:bacteriocin-protection protein, YdeI/OmpD-associated family [Acidobacteriota bacterium]
MPKDNLPIIAFESQSRWEEWLAENHAQQPTGIWLRIFKKGSGVVSVTYAEALDEALCYGWIDGQANKYDERSWLQKFTPRRKKSIWSKVNTQHVERLIEAGKMKAAGLKEIEAAKQDGRWQQAYNSPKNMTVPETFRVISAGHERTESARKLFRYERLLSSSLFAIPKLQL